MAIIFLAFYYSEAVSSFSPGVSKTAGVTPSYSILKDI